MLKIIVFSIFPHRLPMTRNSQLLDLIVLWEHRRAAGDMVTPEELCAECPEMIDALRKSLRALGSMDSAVGDLSHAAHFEAMADPEATHAFNGATARPVGGADSRRPVLPGYDILVELGRGGMGIVYKARQIALERIVAVKTLRSVGWGEEEQRRRFAREAMAMAKLTHPNIVQVYEIGQCDGQPFLVMEYVDGENLDVRLGGKPMPPRAAAELAVQLAGAVHAAHREGVVHRDLKPSNILLTADGTAKICDFGLARGFQMPADCTQTGCLIGTPSYMAPEQALGTRDAHRPTVDVYALGAVLYELLTGRPPFLADNPLDTLKMVASQDPIPLRTLQPHTPRDLETITLKCLAKEPFRRYVSARDLGDDLQRFLSGQPICARPAGGVERLWRWCRRHPGGAASAAIAAAALLLVFAITVGYNRRLAWQLQQTDAARQEVLEADEQLQGTLTREVAQRVDGDLRELAAVPWSIASMLKQPSSLDEAALEAAMRDLLKRSPMIYGLCAAFEPHAWQADRADFALYVYRRGTELSVKQLVPPDYEPHYRKWQWYVAAKDAPQGFWTDPYIDAGPEHTPMVTFSAPIVRDGKFVGVVTADLAMDYFRDLRTSMDRLERGEKSYGFVVSSKDEVLAHRLDDYEFPGPDSDLTRKPLDPSFRALLDQMHRNRTGSGRAIDVATGTPASFYFARVPSTGWTLVTVVEEVDGRR